MSFVEDCEQIASFAPVLGIDVSGREFVGVDAFWPFLERMCQEGAVVAIKLDGERTGNEDNGPYTAAVGGSPLDGDFLRTDAFTIEEAIAFVIAAYGSRKWEKGE